MASALRAQDVVSETTQLYIPSNQWQIEATGWFEDSLARLQYSVQEYAVGPSILTDGSRLSQPWDETTATTPWNESDRLSAPYYKSQCANQLTHDPQGTMSFSILGLIITFAVGSTILLLSTCFETLIGLLQQLLHVGEHQRLAWILDGNLQLQRMLYESMGLGTWDGRTDAVPTTVEKESFRSYDPIAEARARPREEVAREEEQQSQQSQNQRHPQVLSEKDVVVQSRPLLGRHEE